MSRSARSRSRRATVGDVTVGAPVRRDPYRVRAAVAAMLAAVVAMAGALLLVPGAALAHDVLAGSTPSDGQVLDRAPSRVVLSFDDRVLDLSGGNEATIAVGGAHPVAVRPRVSDRDVIVPVPAALRSSSGTWSVAYRIVSADGHPVEGSLGFTVRGASTPGTPSPSGTSSTAGAAGSTSAVPAVTAVASPTPSVAPVASSASRPTWPWWLVGAVLAALVAWVVWVSVRRGRGRRPASR